MRKVILLSFAMLLAAVALSAQTKRPSGYNYRMTTQFKELKINETNIVFLGNSITDFAEWRELFGDQRIVNRGISGNRTSQVLARLDPIVGGKPAKLFLTIGVNDLRNNVAPDVVVANITKIVERFKKESPATKIYIQSILPDNPMDFPGQRKGFYPKPGEIGEVNAQLKKLCADDWKITYIDLHPAMADSEGKLKKEYSNDGIHLLGDAYLVWRDLLTPYVNEK